MPSHTCHVVDMVVNVYSNTTDMLPAASEAVYTDLTTRVEEGTLLSTDFTDVAAVRLHDTTTTTATDDPAKDEETDSTSETFRTGLLIAGLVLLAIVGLVVFVSIRLTRQLRQQIALEASGV